ncbi:cholesterol 25-hydroxylase-like protein [Latimeria chalumnae]|uniref:cholesterol 25-hydroxylase-like protein n=1 Tax=Latimeria chalumnae TaxID=7897 RepID=UPI0003C1120D|nr:PREDICTED: cholesterol 25-hydroxylase-like protein [Latimeria chalumnae]|eukprot:XP_006000356.1 PREDICTED: cholesterol 25-hydroxylase-like protein [Latimeria chalumnae]
MTVPSATTGLLQPLWDSIRNQGITLQLLFFPAALSLFVNLVFCLPFFLIDFLGSRCPFFYQYKIRKSSPIDINAWWVCLRRIIYNHLISIFPATLFYGFVRSGSTTPSEVPSSLEVVCDVILCLLLFDTLYFFGHRLSHKIPWIYRQFHSLHHQHSEPFALSSQYSTALEIAFLHLLATATTFLLNCHPVTEMIFFILNIYLAVEDHCGYDFPWATHRLVPFGIFGGTPFHDVHHKKLRCNYAPYFTHWDRLFRTFRKD